MACDVDYSACLRASLAAAMLALPESIWLLPFVAALAAAALAVFVLVRPWAVATSRCEKYPPGPCS